MWACLLSLAAGAVLLRRWRRSDLPPIDFLALGFATTFGRLWHGCVSTGPLRLPSKGPALVYANHTCSADALFLSCFHPRLLSFMIAREYYEIPWLGALFRHMACVPVRRQGCDVAAIRTGLRRLSEGRILCIFPEGGLSNAGRAQPRRGKAGIALLALRSRQPVHPVRISGGPQTSHILPAWLGPSRARVTIGRALDLSAYYDRPINRQLVEEVSALLMKRLAEIDPRARSHTRRTP